MPVAVFDALRLNWREDGDPAGAPVVFCHGLGCDLTVWDSVIAALPQGFRYLRYDLRGHGGSTAPIGAWSMGAMTRDAERLLQHLGLRDCVFVGHGFGGMIGQALAVKRLDLVRGLVLANTATKLGTPGTWADHAEIARAGGMAAVADQLLPRWFPRFALTSPQAARARDLLLQMHTESYMAACNAVAGTDLYTPTAGLTLPALVISALNDATTPPDLVQETAHLMSGADYAMLRRAGHVSMLDSPAEMAALITSYLDRIGHAALPAEGPGTPGGMLHDHDHDHDHGPDCGCGGH